MISDRTVGELNEKPAVPSAELQPRIDSGGKQPEEKTERKRMQFHDPSAEHRRMLIAIMLSSPVFGTGLLSKTETKKQQTVEEATAFVDKYLMVIE